jgi:hypothetical protein
MARAATEDDPGHDTLQEVVTTLAGSFSATSQTGLRRWERSEELLVHSGEAFVGNELAAEDAEVGDLLE